MKALIHLMVQSTTSIFVETRSSAAFSLRIVVQFLEKTTELNFYVSETTILMHYGAETWGESRPGLELLPGQTSTASFHSITTGGRSRHVQKYLVLSIAHGNASKPLNFPRDICKRSDMIS